MNGCFAELNYALNKPASQSSTLKDAVAGNAVDERIDTLACTLDTTVHPWWSVDLGAAYIVYRVIVTNDDKPEQG